VILVATTRKQENKIMNGLLGLKTPLLEIGKRPLLCCSVETCTWAFTTDHERCMPKTLLSSQISQSGEVAVSLLKGPDKVAMGNLWRQSSLV